MKRLLLIFFILLLWPSLVFGVTSNVTFEWDANTEPDLAGYRLYQATAPGAYTFGTGNEVLNISAGTMTGTINVPNGRYYFVLTAYDTEGLESEPSNEVYTGINAPTGLTITIIIKVQ